MDMIVLNEYFHVADLQGGIPLSPFGGRPPRLSGGITWGIFPPHREMPPIQHNPDITLPGLNQMSVLSWYRELAPLPSPTP